MEGKDFNDVFEKYFSVDTPHTEVILDFRLFVLGDWQRQTIYLQIDESPPIALLTPFSLYDHPLKDWCGFSGFNDNIVRINRAYLHSSKGLTIRIFEQTSCIDDQRSIGISGIDLTLIVQCPSNSKQNSSALCSCNSAFYSLPLSPCPSNRKDICQKCLPCSNYCIKCSFDTADGKVICSQCQESFVLENGRCILKKG